MEHYDVIIVGGGPSGANLARLIGKKYKTLIIEKRDMNGENPDNNLEKCCGGLLAPDAQKIIAHMNLGLPKDILVDPELFAVRTMDLTNNLERLYQRFYFNMDREKFDRWLESLIPAQVKKEFNAVFLGFTSAEADNIGPFQVRYKKIGRNKATTVTCSLLIGADGANSKVRKIIDPKGKTPVKYIAIQEWYECEKPMPYYTAIFDEEISDFYSWTIPKGNYILLGAALRPKDKPWEKFQLLKEKLMLKGFDLSKKTKTEGAMIFRTKHLPQILFGKGNVLLIGEAAGAISPSSAEGFSYGLRTSFYLSQAMENGLKDVLKSYKGKAKKIKINLLLKNLKSPAMYNKQLRHMAMRSRLNAMK